MWCVSNWVLNTDVFLLIFFTLITRATNVKVIPTRFTKVTRLTRRTVRHLGDNVYLVTMYYSLPAGRVGFGLKTGATSSFRGSCFCCVAAVFAFSVMDGNGFSPFKARTTYEK